MIDAVTSCYVNISAEHAARKVPGQNDVESDARRKEVRSHLARLYGRMRCNPAIRKLAALERVIKEEDQQRFMTSRCQRVWYWIRPAVFMFVCFCTQSVLLHMATHYYVRYMDNYDVMISQSQTVTVTSLAGDDALDMVLSDELAVDQQFRQAIEEGTLYDPLARLIKVDSNSDIPLWLIDLSGIVPLVMWLTSYVVTFFLGDSQVSMWTKTLFIGGLMALLKGVCDVITIVPDSGGWQNCQERMGESGMLAMRKELSFSGGDFFGSFGRLLAMELKGSGDGGRMRYCADMLISGHTYFAVLFSLSTYKMLRYETEKHNKRWLRKAIGFVCCACVFAEFYVVLQSRFHYSIDMVLSILFVGLLYDFTHTITRKIPKAQSAAALAQLVRA